MAKFWDHITGEQAELIRSAPLFFVASADPALAPGESGEGGVNVSPKGAARLHQVDERHVAYLDYPGSGNETARHAAAGGPITLMVCSFEPGDAAIVRLYGRARVMPLEECRYADAMLEAPRGAMLSTRQVVEVTIERTMTSCGYGVPVMQLVRERERPDRGGKFKPAAAVKGVIRG
ncbi:MAG: pyridoxamine 5'-phosphate oxidase family protein [Candidatus Eiseniibacteriota bacterium]